MQTSNLFQAGSMQSRRSAQGHRGVVLPEDRSGPGSGIRGDLPLAMGVGHLDTGAGVGNLCPVAKVTTLSTKGKSVVTAKFSMPVFCYYYFYKYSIISNLIEMN